MVNGSLRSLIEYAVLMATAAVLLEASVLALVQGITRRLDVGELVLDVVTIPLFAALLQGSEAAVGFAVAMAVVIPWIAGLRYLQRVGWLTRQ